MAKNIIVCADGTGNKGGTTPDSNVYKIYKSIDKHCENQNAPDIERQIIFYDNGVGTEKNKFLRAISGAFGFGFKQNVCDLYEHLARNYAPGDKIYFFGFSRGASTVRACNGFIYTCGLLKGAGLSNEDLKEKVKKAFKAYKKHAKSDKAQKLKESTETWDNTTIHFMGIWDTVVALGFPKRTDVTGIVSAVLNAIFWASEGFLNWLWPHNFYHYRLTDNIRYAYQALSIDDERTSFWPFVWREQNKAPDAVVEQVWFAGMHSNVGGGYPRSGMASVPLYWMMIRAERSGLIFYEDAVRNAYDDSHDHGRMYNSRDGFSMLYRYHPREIEKLCKDHKANRLLGDIRIHDSVIKRMRHRTANYAPGHIPGEFVVVKSDPDAPPVKRIPCMHPGWKKIRNRINFWVWMRKSLYASMLTAVLGILGATLWFWNNPPTPVERTGFWGRLADVLDYFLFDCFDGLIEFAVVQHHNIFITVVIAALIYLVIRYVFRMMTVKACEKLRRLIIEA